MDYVNLIYNSQIFIQMCMMAGIHSKKEGKRERKKKSLQARHFPTAF